VWVDEDADTVLCTLTDDSEEVLQVVLIVLPRASVLYRLPGDQEPQKIETPQT
jgi:hypothetical protein